MVHGRLNWCLGCGRSLPEIKGWNSFSAQERSALRGVLSDRMDIIHAQFGPKAKNKGEST